MVKNVKIIDVGEILIIFGILYYQSCTFVRGRKIGKIATYKGFFSGYRLDIYTANLHNSVNQLIRYFFSLLFCN